MRPLCKSNAPKYRLSNNWLIRIFTTVVKLTVLGGIAPPRIAPLLNGIRLELDCENDWLWVTKTWLTWRRRRLNMADSDLAKYDWRRRHCNDDSGRIHHYLERVIPPRCLRIGLAMCFLLLLLLFLLLRPIGSTWIHNTQCPKNVHFFQMTLSQINRF